MKLNIFIFKNTPHYAIAAELDPALAEAVFVEFVVRKCQTKGWERIRLVKGQSILVFLAVLFMFDVTIT